MRFGVVILPDRRWTEVVRLWRHVEELGFDHACSYDHLSWRSLRDEAWFGAVPTLAAAALATSRVRLGTLVASPNFRHPVPFAKELVTLDRLDLRALLERLARACDELGRDPDTLDRLLLTGTSEARPLALVDAFRACAEGARGLGFTDLVVHYPRASGPSRARCTCSSGSPRRPCPSSASAAPRPEVRGLCCLAGLLAHQCSTVAGSGGLPVRDHLLPDIGSPRVVGRVRSQCELGSRVHGPATALRASVGYCRR